MDERERDFLAMLGYVYLQHGDAANACVVLEVVRLSRPHDREVARALAYALLQVERFQECLDLTDFLLAGSGREESTLVWLLRCRALLGLGRCEEARELWKKTGKGNRPLS